MAYEQKNMEGSLFRAKEKASDKHPDSTGSATIDGVEYWLSGWTNKRENGDKWVKLTFKRKDEAKREAPKRQVEPDDEPLPF